MEWKNANKILPERGHRVLCLYPNGKMAVSYTHLTLPTSHLV